MYARPQDDLDIGNLEFLRTLSLNGEFIVCLDLNLNKINSPSNLERHLIFAAFKFKCSIQSGEILDNSPLNVELITTPAVQIQGTSRAPLQAVKKSIQPGKKNVEVARKPTNSAMLRRWKSLTAQMKNQQQ